MAQILLNGSILIVVNDGVITEIYTTNRLLNIIFFDEGVEGETSIFEVSDDKFNEIVEQMRKDADIEDEIDISDLL